MKTLLLLRFFLSDFSVLPDVQKFSLSDNQIVTKTYYELFILDEFYILALGEAPELRGSTYEKSRN